MAALLFLLTESCCMDTGVIFGGRGFLGYRHSKRYFAQCNLMMIRPVHMYYWMNPFIVLLNITEFVIVIYTSTRVKKGENIRWFGIASLTDRLCSKEDRNPYKL